MSSLLSSDVSVVFDLCDLGGPSTVDRDVDAIVQKILSVVDDLNATRVTIGSTYADIDTNGKITREGVEDRWNQTYKDQGYFGLLVVASVTKKNIPGCFKKYKVTPVQFVRLIERLVDDAIPEDLDATDELAGGGRSGKTIRKVGLVYAAIG